MRGSGRLRLLLVLLVLTAFTVTALDYRAGEGSPSGVLRRTADAVLSPAQRALGGAVDRVLGAGRGGPETARLRAENDRLRAELRASDGLRAQVREWNALLGLTDAADLTVLPAKVVALGSALGFELTATIDVGSRDGVRVGQTVVNGQGLVGRTKRVGATTSLVVLLADREFSVGVRLVRTGRLGIATGDGRAGLTYQLLGQSDRAVPGDAVFTSGSATFVAGLPVGEVTATDRDPNALVRSGVLRPYADLGTLDLVGVVLSGPRTAPRRPLPVPRAPASPSPAAPSPSRSPSPAP